MKTKITCILLLAFLKINAQETIFVLKNHYMWNEEYYALKNNKKIKHGHYVSYYLKQGSHILEEKGKYFNEYSASYTTEVSLIEEGNYSFGKRDGIWMRYYDNRVAESSIFNLDSLNGEYTYYWNDTIPAAISTEFKNNKGSKKDSLIVDIKQDSLFPAFHGYFKNNKVCDIWSYYGRKGDLYFQYDHDDSVLIKDSFNKLENVFISSTPEIAQPIYINGGCIGLKYELSLFFPLFLEKNTKILLLFNISKNGRIESVIWNNSTLGKKITRKIENAIKFGCVYWIPRKIGGQFVDSMFQFEFKLNDKDKWTPVFYPF